MIIMWIGAFPCRLKSDSPLRRLQWMPANPSCCMAAMEQSRSTLSTLTTSANDSVEAMHNDLQQDERVL